MDNNMTIVGYACLVIAVVWVVYKVRLSYMSFGGTVMVTVYDAAFFPPVIGAFGLYFVGKSLGFEFPIWAYCVLAPVVGVLVGIAIRLAEELGDGRR